MLSHPHLSKLGMCGRFLNYLARFDLLLGSRCVDVHRHRHRKSPVALSIRILVDLNGRHIRVSTALHQLGSCRSSLASPCQT